MAIVEDSWSIGPQPAVSTWSLLRVDYERGTPRITFTVDMSDGALADQTGVSSLTSLSEDGLDLLTRYVEMRQHLSDTGRLPERTVFGSGQHTTELPSKLETFKVPEPWEDSRSAWSIDESSSKVGLSYMGRQGEVSCGVVKSRTTQRHRDGKPIAPSPILGDAAILVGDGLYTAFVVESLHGVCVTLPKTGPPDVVGVTSARVTVEGVK